MGRWSFTFRLVDTGCMPTNKLTKQYVFALEASGPQRGVAMLSALSRINVLKVEHGEVYPSGSTADDRHARDVEASTVGADGHDATERAFAIGALQAFARDRDAFTQWLDEGDPPAHLLRRWRRFTGTPTAFLSTSKFSWGDLAVICRLLGMTYVACRTAMTGAALEQAVRTLTSSYVWRRRPWTFTLTDRQASDARFLRRYGRWASVGTGESLLQLGLVRCSKAHLMDVRMTRSLTEDVFVLNDVGHAVALRCERLARRTKRSGR